MAEAAAKRGQGDAYLGVSLAVLKATALVLAVLKLALVAGSGTFMDEAYYWLWGQHPALSYYDHPPLNAWVQGLSGALFGWNRFAMRLPVVLSLAGTAYVLWLFARRFAAENPQPVFWASLVLLLATPIFFVTSAVALPDHLLIVFGMASIYCFSAFLVDWRPGKSWRGLWLGAVWLGLATLSKYNGAFIGIGVGLAIVAMPRLRPLLFRWQLWAAAALSVAMQAPVLIWNLTNGLSSFGFVLGARHGGLTNPLDGVVPLLLSLPVFLSPFLLWPMLRFAIGRRPEQAPARWMFWVSTLAMLALATQTTALFHWNLVAYLALLGFAAYQFGNRWLFGAHVLFGGVFLAGAGFNYVVAPIGDVPQIRDEGSAWVYGWSEIADAVTEARQTHKAGFVATSDYTTASLLAVALADRDVTSLSPRIDQFDFWFDAAAHSGQDAILYTDSFRGLDAAVAARFESVTLLKSFTVERFGRPLGQRQIHLAKGFYGAQ